MSSPIQTVLDQSIPFDQTKVQLIDAVTQAMNSGKLDDINRGNQMWTKLKQDPMMWTRLQLIFNNSKCHNTKFFMLVLTENSVKNNWNILRNQDREIFRNYLLQLFMQLSTSQKNDDPTLSKLNSIIVQIGRRQWQTTWPDFLSQICKVSLTDQNICYQGLKILRYLSQQIFDFSKNTITSQQIRQLKARMTNQFTCVFQFCNKILSASQQTISLSLLKACLQTLWAFMSWIPLHFIFQTELISKLLIFFKKDTLRNFAYKNIIQIVSLQITMDLTQGKLMMQKLIFLSTQIQNHLDQLLPIHVDIRAQLANMQRNNPRVVPHFQQFCMGTALFFTSMFKANLLKFEQLFNSNHAVSNIINKGMKYLLMLTNFPNQQCYKTVCQFWLYFTSRLLQEGSLKAGFTVLSFYSSQSNPKQSIYRRIFMQLRHIVIFKMVKPDQVRIVIDQNGIPQLQQQANTDQASMCQLLNNIITNLTKLDQQNTKSVILGKLQRQSTDDQFTYDRLNSLCWAVGAMPGILQDSKQKIFLISVVRILLNLCQNKKGKENKAVIATNIMYVVGRYPSFLNNNWVFLRTVVKKLYQFMREPFPGIMQMAVKTLLKISDCSKHQFVIVQQNQSYPYINTMLGKIGEDAMVLSQDGQRLIFFEAIGRIISAQPTQGIKSKYLFQAIFHYKKEFDTIITQGFSNSNLLKQQKVIKKISLFIKINQRLAHSTGFGYLQLANNIFPNLTNLFNFYTSCIDNQFKQIGPVVINYVSVKRYRAIRKQILVLFTSFVNHWDHVPPQYMYQAFNDLFAAHLQKVLSFFSKSLPQLRDPQVVGLFSATFQKLHPVLQPHVIGTSLQTIFESVLPMITQNFQSFPDMRLAFFGLIKTTVLKCFAQLFSIPQHMFRMLIYSVAWSFKHDLNNINQVGLQLMQVVLKTMHQRKDVSDNFYSKFFNFILDSIMHVIFDGYHKSGFKYQCKILMLLIQACHKGLSVSPIFPQQTKSNMQSLFQWMSSSCGRLFPSVSIQKTSEYMRKVFEMGINNDEKQFKRVLRDYLIQSSKNGYSSKIIQ